MIGDLVAIILGLPALAIYLIVGLVVFAEDALFVGFVLPGETLAILGGATAKLGNTTLWIVWLVVVVAAIVGDSVGYEVGKKWGSQILAHRKLDKYRTRLDDASEMLRERGGVAVFVSRWTAFLRAVTPALSGAVGMPYRVFLPWNALGGLAWGSVVVFGGYAAGASYEQVAKWMGRGTAAIVGLIILVGFLVWHLRKERKEATKPVAHS